jgi:EmrB/QacA subfamily drug resistance transporter
MVEVLSHSNATVAAGSPASAAVRKQVLAVMCLALVLVVANVSMLNVALRAVGLDLSATSTQQHWIVDSYAVAFAALLLPCGALGDRYGRRTVMLIGMAISAVAAVIAALATSVDVLITARVISGVGAAMIMPGTLSSITHVFPADERGKAVGTWAGFASAGGIIGLLVGGLVLEVTTWPAIFWLSAALSVLVFLGTVKVVPNSKDPDDANIDPVGSALSVIGIATLVFGIIEGPVDGWGSSKVVGALAVSILALVGFVAWELKSSKPVLDVRLFANRAFGSGSLSIFVQFFAAFGFFYVSIQYLQGMLGYSPLRSAVGLLPMGAMIVPLSAAAPGIARRLGLKVVNAAGLGFMASGLFVFSLLSTGSGYWPFLGGLFLFGAGMALSTAPASESIINSVPKSKHGVASAVNDTTRELGGALGIAIIGTAFTSGYRNAVGVAPASAPQEVVAAVASSPLGGLKTAAEVGPRLGAEGTRFLENVQNSFVDGFSASMRIGALAAFVGMLFVLWRSPQTVSAPTDEAVDAS